MKKTLSFILVCILITACHSQKISANLQDKLNQNKKEYFFGIWKLTQRNYKEGNETKKFPLHECMKEYKLIFTPKKKLSYLTKVYATGENCAIKSQADEVQVTITDSSFLYTEYDLKKSDQYKIYSKNKFSIIYNDIISGKVTEIEDIYER